MRTSVSEPTAADGLRVTLAGCRLFDGLPARDLEALAAIARVVVLAKGRVLFHEGEPSRGFFVVRTGVVIVSRFDAKGREQVIHRLSPGDSFAEASLTAPGGYPARATAATATSVLLLPKAPFLALLEDRPELALRIMAAMSRHIRALVDRLRALGSQEAHARLARHLLDESRGLDRYDLSTTRRVLAAQLGMAEETLSRAFARLASAGWLRARGRSVTLLDRAALVRTASA